MKLLFVFIMVMSTFTLFASVDPSRQSLNRAPAIPNPKDLVVEKELTLEEELDIVLNSTRKVDKNLQAKQNSTEEFVEDSISTGQAGLMKKPMTADEIKTLDSIDKEEMPDPIHESDYLRELKPAAKKLRKRSR